MQDSGRFIAASFDYETVKGAVIVAALTAATAAKDLADAFAWIESSSSEDPRVKTLLPMLSYRATLIHGSTVPPGSVSVPLSARAFNNEVAYCMIARCLNLDFEVRLTGLRGAAHLNGREGVIRGEDPANRKRWKVFLEDGTYVSVLAVNFEHLRRGDFTYKRTSLRVAASS